MIGEKYRRVDLRRLGKNIIVSRFTGTGHDQNQQFLSDS